MGGLKQVLVVPFLTGMMDDGSLYIFLGDHMRRKIVYNGIVSLIR